MNIKAIIASLVLASSSAAMAAPAVTVVARDHRAEVSVAIAPVYTPVAQPVYSQPERPAYYPGWRRPQPVTLASGLRFANADRATITVGRRAGQFGSLQLSATSGSNLIKLINIVFADGTHQTVRNINRTLVANQSLMIDLDGDRRAIRDITVYGSAVDNGWRRRGGSFTVTAL
jgi:hypothetical protein